LIPYCRAGKLTWRNGELSEKIIETLFAIAADGYAKLNGVNVFRSVEAILRSLAFDIETGILEATALKLALQRIYQLVSAEIVADVSGLRSLQTFPAYSLGFECSLPMLVQAVAMKAKVDSDRKWHSPFSICLKSQKSSAIITATCLAWTSKGLCFENGSLIHSTQFCECYFTRLRTRSRAEGRSSKLSLTT